MLISTCSGLQRQTRGVRHLLRHQPDERCNVQGQGSWRPRLRWQGSRVGEAEPMALAQRFRPGLGVAGHARQRLGRVLQDGTGQFGDGRGDPVRG